MTASSDDLTRVADPIRIDRDFTLDGIAVLADASSLRAHLTDR